MMLQCDVVCCLGFFLFFFWWTGDRNTLGADLIYISKQHKGHDLLRGFYEGGDVSAKTEFDLNPEHFHGVAGKILLTQVCVETAGYVENATGRRRRRNSLWICFHCYGHRELASPVTGLPDLYDCHVVW